MFTHDAEEALRWGAALVNTMPDERPEGSGDADTLTTLDELAQLFLSQPWSGRFDRDAAELAAVRALRPTLRQFWEVQEVEAVALLNGILADARAVPQLVDHDDVGWHIHATPLDAPLDTRMAVEFAIAMIDVIRAGGLDRLRVCEGPDCDDVVVDLSRNRSRRYCEGGCAARVHTSAYRARQAEA